MPTSWFVFRSSLPSCETQNHICANSCRILQNNYSVGILTPDENHLSWLAKVLLMQWADSPVMRWQCIELFSGKGNVSAFFRQVGKAVASFDHCLGQRAMDITTSAGFLLGAQIAKSTFCVSMGYHYYAQFRIPMHAINNSYICCAYW